MRKIFTIVLMMVMINLCYAVEPVFNHVNSNWGGPLPQDMNEFWEYSGLQEQGYNYYVTPGPGENTYWERFNPENPRYQAWCGIYVSSNFEYTSEWENFHSNKSGSAQRAIDFMISDMGGWLDHFAHPEGWTITVVNPFSVVVKKYNNKWYHVSFIMHSGSDVGGYFEDYDPEQTMYSLYPEEGYEIFSDLIEPYHDMLFYCTMQFRYDPELDLFLVKYGVTGIAWYLKSGQLKHATPVVYQEIAQMMKNIEIP